MARTIVMSPEEIEAARLERKVVATPTQWLKIKRARLLKRRIDAMEKEHKKLRDELDQEMDEADAKALLWGGETVATRSVTDTTRFDWKTFQEKNPEVVVGYMVPQHYTTMKIPT